MSFADYTREKLRNTNGFGFMFSSMVGALVACLVMVLTIKNYSVPAVVKAKYPNEAERLELIMIEHSQLECEKIVSLAEDQARAGKKDVPVNGINSRIATCLKDKGFIVEQYTNSVYSVKWSEQ